MPVRIQFDERELDSVERLFRRAMTKGGGFDRYGIGPQARGTTGEAPGPETTEVDQFERELESFFGVAHVVAVSSGTAAVHSALMALGLEPGTEVVTSSLTDPGVVMAIINSLCVPVFCDHDYETVLPSQIEIEAVLSPRTGAIIVTHVMGLVCDMGPIMELGQRHGVKIIGDAAQAHAARYDGSRSAPFGDVGAVSTMSTKHMTSGGQGGFAATDDGELALRIKRFSDRGKAFGASAQTSAAFGGDRIAIGLNYRMTDLEATIGRVQLTKLDDVMTKRGAVMRSIYEGIADLDGVRPVRVVSASEPNPWALMFAVDSDRMRVDGEGFARAMTAEGVPMTTVIPTLIPAVDQLSFLRTQTTFGDSHFPYGHRLQGRRVAAARPHHPNVDRLAQDLVALWIHEGWTGDEISDTMTAMHEVSNAYAL